MQLEKYAWHLREDLAWRYIFGHHQAQALSFIFQACTTMSSWKQQGEYLGELKKCGVLKSQMSKVLGGRKAPGIVLGVFLWVEESNESWT